MKLQSATEGIVSLPKRVAVEESCGSGGSRTHNSAKHDVRFICKGFAHTLAEIGDMTAIAITNGIQ